MAKETDITVEGARELVANKALWPRVRDFLWDFAPQVHPSWLGDLGLPEGLNGSVRAKNFLLAQLGVEPCFHAFPKDDGSRLLLLDGAALESIAKWLGALACASKLRGVTSGADVRALKAALPGIYPDVFGYMAYFERFKIEEFKIEDLGFDFGSGFVEKVGVLGGWILYFTLDSLPPPLLARLTLKLPKTYPSDSRPDANLQSSIFNLQLVTRLLKLKFPEAYSLCCS